jgi:hypothetical protein
MPVAFWAGLLALWSAVQLIFKPQLIGVLLQAGAALGVAVLAAVVSAATRDDPRRIPELSMATVGLALGLSGVLLGAEIGPWCIAMGAGIAALSLGGLVRERRAQPAARHVAADPESEARRQGLDPDDDSRAARDRVGG